MKHFVDFIIGKPWSKNSQNLVSYFVLTMSESNEKASETHKEFEGEEQSDVVSNGLDEGKDGAENLDMTNSKAFKGNDSDGKVRWTAKSIGAALSLSMLNAGKGQSKLN